MTIKHSDESMPIHSVLRYFKSQHALADRLCVTQQAISKWKRLNMPIPAEHVLTIESITKGEFSRHYLRPDLYPPE